jgi:AcrR family transcriptional regulator
MRPANPHNQKRQVAKILGQARRLYARRGYDCVSMDMLAAACRVSKPTLYYYFKDKRAVLLAVLRTCWMEQAGMLKAFRPGANLEQTLHALAELVLTETRRPENGDIIRIVLAEAGRHREFGKAFFEVFGPVFGKVLLGPIRQHLHRRYSDRMVLALFHQYVGSLVHYALMHQVFRAGRSHLPAQRTYVALLVDSFLRSTAPSSPELPSVR